MWRTRLCDLLGIEYPIIEGGLGIPGNGELAAAISNAGALGQIGFNPGDEPPEKQGENLRKHIRICKSLTKKPFGVNVALVMVGPERERSESSLDIIIEERVPVVSVSGGSPNIATKKLHAAGIKVIHMALNVQHARSAEAAGVDAVIASGFDAGGLLGPDEIPTLVLVPLVAEAVKIPVIAAGGIADARGFLAALALGADGIQMGTRFLATSECFVHPAYKKAIVEAGPTDTVVTRRNTFPMPRVRSLRNALTIKLAELDRKGAPPEEIRAAMAARAATAAEMHGDMKDGDPICGISAALVKEILPAGEVVRRIIADAQASLDRCNAIASGKR